MLGKPQTPDKRDPEEMMMGICPACGKAVECRRKETVRDKSDLMDTPYAECKNPPTAMIHKRTTCGARVYVTVKPIVPSEGEFYG